MERRFKLAMAAVALGLLIAGAVRRRIREDGFSLSNTPGVTVAETDLSAPSGFDARQTASWSPADESLVAPAAAQFPVRPARQFSEPGPAAAPPSALTPAPTYFTPADAEVPRASIPPHTSHPAPPVPESVAAPPATPAGFYVIQPNDSFWTISQRVYGTGRYFQALYEHNRRICPQPDRLPAGVTIETPETYLLERAFPDFFR